MLSQIISNFLKIITGITQGFILKIPRVNTETYWSNSVEIEVIKDWKKTTKKM